MGIKCIYAGGISCVGPNNWCAKASSVPRPPCFRYGTKGGSSGVWWVGQRPDRKSEQKEEVRHNNGLLRHKWLLQRWKRWEKLRDSITGRRQQLSLSTASEDLPQVSEVPTGGWTRSSLEVPPLDKVCYFWQTLHNLPILYCATD